MRRTIVVHNRLAWRSQRTQAALARAQGFQLFTIEQLAARLAGGFLAPIDGDDLKAAVTTAVAAPLGDLDEIKVLPGFQRAAAATLHKCWTAGLELARELAETSDESAKRRLQSLLALERGVLADLPKSQLRAVELVTAARARIDHARSIFGTIEIHGRTEMSPVWRPLVAALATATEVAWVADARRVPGWVSSIGLEVRTRAAARPTATSISCATPRHEILEAVRWARRHLAEGVEPWNIAIGAASPEAWDDHVLALANASGLPVHFVHGRAALATGEGQLAAALAEILLRGFSQTRMRRFIGLLRSEIPRFSALPGQWWRALPEDAPLLDTAGWRRAIAVFTAASFPDGIDHRALLTEIVDTIAKGLGAAAATGEALLTARSLAIWRKALVEGPPAALDVTLSGLRVDDGLEPEAAIIWAPASAIAAVPRPFTWLVGLTSRSWPRRTAEDPLLPDHVIASSRLDPLPIHEADRRDFRTIRAMTSQELVSSRARRDSEGRINGISPLYPRDVAETHLGQSRDPEHAASATDRLFARPPEFAAFPLAQAARQTWIDWHSGRITAHDGLVRANHPLLMRSLDRRQSASSLVKLARDPLGYLWTYGFRWSAPEETDEPLTFDPLSFGNLLHEILEEAVTLLETGRPGAFAKAGVDEIRRAVEAAGATVAARWEESRPLPPPVVWRRKRQDAMDLAVVALTHQEASLSDQQSWAEIPFGDDRRAQELTEAARLALPWDPLAPVMIPGTDIRIGGAIDRLDLAGDRKRARVTDYKSGKLGQPAQLKGGAELQRCLYACAVKTLITTGPEVEARLFYPRKGGRVLVLEEPEVTLAKLAGYLAAAGTSFAAGRALPGPAAAESWYDLAIALPGGATESYLAVLKPLVANALTAVAPLWDEP
jgi:hypothetical protein